ncbi:hypothetical protein [Halalkalibacter urbisdiaboli]|uniref:hypothetical protein n=1 Tax=Halalkalibacter urbisdiaboli TaxID=1960589 RepID=UPI00105526D3|nr:hypothetical protein [Halalkalibacter urbisdiaboli]
MKKKHFIDNNRLYYKGVVSLKLKAFEMVIWLFIVLVVVIFSAGCSVTELEGDTPPIPSVTVGEENIEVVRASYCWNTGCVDYAGPPEILEGKVPFQVQKGENIKIQFDYEPKPFSISVSRMLDTDQEWVKDELVNGVLTVPNEEGIYYYDFLVNWHSEDGKYSLGDSFYAFAIEVK